MGQAAVREHGDPADDGAALVLRVSQGDQAAFRAVVAAYLPSVLIAARRLLGDASEAEDVGQEVFVRFWRQASELLDRPLNLGGWLRRVAVNLCLDRLRRTRRLEVRDEVPDVGEGAGQLRGLEESEAGERVLAAIAQLPERQRVALVLFHFEERTQKDVAETMGITEDALESLLARARRKLKEVLADDWRGLLESLNPNGVS